MPEYSVVKEQRKYFPLYYTSRKNRPVEHPKSTFWKIFLIVHKIHRRYLCSTPIILLASRKTPLSLHYIPRISRPWKPYFSRKYIPLLYSREKRSMEHLKSTFCENILSKRWYKLFREVRGRGTKPAPLTSFLSPCPVVYNSLRQLHTAGLHPLTILAAASRERNYQESVKTIYPSTVLPKK